MQKNNALCSLCGSKSVITFHHLIPKSCHSNKWFKKNFTKQTMINEGIYICSRCHSFIHKKFDEKTLGRELNTLNKLLSNEIIAKYIKWAGRRH